VAVFITDAPAKCAPTICSLSESDSPPIIRFFHKDCHSKQSTNMPTRALQSVNKWKMNIWFCQLKLFQCSQHKFYSSISKCFHYFIHPFYLVGSDHASLRYYADTRLDELRKTTETSLKLVVVTD
jgi:hypothetical protein